VIYFLLAEKKNTDSIMQYYTMHRINIWGFQMQKTFTWGGGLPCKGVVFPPLQCHAEKQLPHFPQADGPTPSPYPTSQPNRPTQVIKFKLAEDDISTS
jgi:hypothetical protein